MAERPRSTQSVEIPLPAAVKPIVSPTKRGTTPGPDAVKSRFPKLLAPPDVSEAQKERTREDLRGISQSKFFNNNSFAAAHTATPDYYTMYDNTRRQLDTTASLVGEASPHKKEQEKFRPVMVKGEVVNSYVEDENGDQKPLYEDDIIMARYKEREDYLKRKREMWGDMISMHGGKLSRDRPKRVYKDLIWGAVKRASQQSVVHVDVIEKVAQTSGLQLQEELNNLEAKVNDKVAKRREMYHNLINTDGYGHSLEGLIGNVVSDFSAELLKVLRAQLQHANDVLEFDFPPAESRTVHALKTKEVIISARLVVERLKKEFENAPTLGPSKGLDILAAASRVTDKDAGWKDRFAKQVLNSLTVHELEEKIQQLQDEVAFYKSALDRIDEGSNMQNLMTEMMELKAENKALKNRTIELRERLSSERRSLNAEIDHLKEAVKEAGEYDTNMQNEVKVLTGENEELRAKVAKLQEYLREAEHDLNKKVGEFEVNVYDMEAKCARSTGLIRVEKVKSKKFVSRHFVQTGVDADIDDIGAALDKQRWARERLFSHLINKYAGLGGASEKSKAVTKEARQKSIVHTDPIFSEKLDAFKYARKEREVQRREREKKEKDKTIASYEEDMAEPSYFQDMSFVDGMAARIIQRHWRGRIILLNMPMSVRKQLRFGVGIRYRQAILEMQKKKEAMGKKRANRKGSTDALPNSPNKSSPSSFMAKVGLQVEKTPQELEEEKAEKARERLAVIKMIIVDIYRLKLICDLHCDQSTLTRITLSHAVYMYFLIRYGVRCAAERALLEFFVEIKPLISLERDICLFSRLLGVPGQKFYGEVSQDFFIYAISILLVLDALALHREGKIALPLACDLVMYSLDERWCKKEDRALVLQKLVEFCVVEGDDERQTFGVCEDFISKNMKKYTKTINKGSVITPSIQIKLKTKEKIEEEEWAAAAAGVAKEKVVEESFEDRPEGEGEGEGEIQNIQVIVPENIQLDLYKVIFLIIETWLSNLGTNQVTIRQLFDKHNTGGFVKRRTKSEVEKVILEAKMMEEEAQALQEAMAAEEEERAKKAVKGNKKGKKNAKQEEKVETNTAASKLEAAKLLMDSLVENEKVPYIVDEGRKEMFSVEDFSDLLHEVDNSISTFGVLDFFMNTGSTVKGSIGRIKKEDFLLDTEKFRVASIEMYPRIDPVIRRESTRGSQAMVKGKQAQYTNYWEAPPNSPPLIAVLYKKYNVLVERNKYKPSKEARDIKELDDIDPMVSDELLSEWNWLQSNWDTSSSLCSARYGLLKKKDPNTFFDKQKDSMSIGVELKSSHPHEVFGFWCYYRNFLSSVDRCTNPTPATIFL